MSLTLMLLTLLVPQVESVPAARDSAVLRVGNRAVAVFRGPLGAAAPAERAAGAARRIAAAMAVGGDSVTTREVPEGVLVLVEGRPVFTLTPADADTAGGTTLEDEARLVLERLRLAVAETGEARDVRALLVAFALVAVATLVLALALRALVAGRRRAHDSLRALTAAAAPHLRIRGVALLRSDQLRGAAGIAVNAVAWVLGAIAIYVYLSFVLTRFPWTRAWGEALGRYLLTLFARLGLGALQALPNLFTVAVIFFATRFGAGLVNTLFAAVERGALVIPGLAPETAAPTRRIAVALVWMFALVVAYPFLPGSESAAFKGVSVFAGLLVTLGSAGLVGQAMSGLVLMYSRSYKEGDFVQIGSTQGTVVDLGLLSTRLRTVKNEYVTLPSAVVTAGGVTNYSAGQGHRHPLTLYSSVTIGYDTPWRRVHELLVEAARRCDGILGEPAPFVLQRALNDWYVEYQLNAAIDPAHAAELPAIYSRLHGSVQDAFGEAGVEIMSPTYVALRDGNTVTIPAPQRPAGRAAAFRVEVNPT